MRWIAVTAGNDEEQKLTFDEFKTDSTLDQLTKVVVPAVLYTKPELAEILSISYKRLSNSGRVVLIKPKWFTKTPTVVTEGENPLQKFLRVKAEWNSEQISHSLTLRLLKINGFLRLVETDELIVGQKDEDPFSNALPLVTIAIPAYKSDFFEHSLLSAMGQSYPRKIILVADEGVDSGVFEIYKTLTERYPHIQVKYVRHERPLGEVGNFEFCRARAQGKYLKYLNDDDILDPQCVERFVRYMEAFDDSVTLIASRRNVVNHENVELLEPPLKPFEPLFPEDAYAYGLEIIEHCLSTNMNQLGEPTVIMFKTQDTEPELTKINDPEYPCSYDMVLNFKLLLKGNLIYLSDALSLFRVHSNQVSMDLKANLHGYCVWTNMILSMKKAGCFSNLGEYKMALERAYSMQVDALEKFKQPEDREALLQAAKPIIDELQKLTHIQVTPKVVQNVFSLKLS